MGSHADAFLDPSALVGKPPLARATGYLLRFSSETVVPICFSAGRGRCLCSSFWIYGSCCSGVPPCRRRPSPRLHGHSGRSSTIRRQLRSIQVDRQFSSKPAHGRGMARGRYYGDAGEPFLAGSRADAGTLCLVPLGFRHLGLGLLCWSLANDSLAAFAARI